METKKKLVNEEIDPLTQLRAELNKRDKTIGELCKEVESLLKIAQEQVEMAANPPQRALSLAEQIMNQVGMHEDCIRDAKTERFAVKEQLLCLDKTIAFHENMSRSLKQGLSAL